MTKQSRSTKPSLREKLAKVGVRNLTDSELIVVLLGSGTTQLSVAKIAGKLLTAFSLSKLHQSSLKELAQIPGVGFAQACRILAAVELGRRNGQPTREKIINPEAVLAHAAYIRLRRREHTLCLYLNGRHELLHKEVVAVGGLNYSLLEPRDVFSPAVSLPAASIILVHNHPSGSADPSREDLAVTDKLREAGKLLGITLLDHLIVTKDSYVSLREAGHFDKK